jgi:hypothetical protein
VDDDEDVVVVDDDVDDDDVVGVAEDVDVVEERSTILVV